MNTVAQSATTSRQPGNSALFSPYQGGPSGRPEGNIEEKQHAAKPWPIATSSHHERRYASLGEAADTLEPLTSQRQLDVPLARVPSRPQTPSHSPLPACGSTPASPAAMFLASFSPRSASSATFEIGKGHVVSGYTLESVIGRGGFSTIWSASSTNEGTVAVKIVKRSDLGKAGDATEAQKRLDAEASLWGSLSHEHILPLFSHSRTAETTYFVTLFCPAGSLFDILQREGTPALPHDDAGTMFRQIVRGLRYLHETVGLLHGDIKLENILVDEFGVCRISDLGLSRKISNTEGTVPAHSHRERLSGMAVHLSLVRRKGARSRHSSPMRNGLETHVAAHPAHQFPPGSLPYAAPELLMPSQASSSFCHPSQDIWALGVLLYALMVGRLPFSDSYEPRLTVKILHGVYDLPDDLGLAAEQVIDGCLAMDVHDRWTIAMVDDAAWGVGWGTSDSVELPEQPLVRKSKSRSTSRRPSGSSSIAEAPSRSVSRPPLRHRASSTRSLGSVEENSDREDLFIERGRKAVVQREMPIRRLSSSPSPTPRTPSDEHLGDLVRGRAIVRSQPAVLTMAGPGEEGLEIPDGWPIPAMKHTTI